MRRLVFLMMCISTMAACTSAPAPVGNQGTPSAVVSPSGPANLPGRFVEVPPNQTQRYSIVAAGTVSVPGMRGAAYNNLRVVGFSQTTGTIRLTFDGYAQPTETTRLIVKALASDENETGGPFVVFLHGFASDGFELRVKQLNGGRASLDSVTLAVEVSRYSPAD